MGNTKIRKNINKNYSKEKRTYNKIQFNLNKLDVIWNNPYIVNNDILYIFIILFFLTLNYDLSSFAIINFNFLSSFSLKCEENEKDSNNSDDLQHCPPWNLIMKIGLVFNSK